MADKMLNPFAKQKEPYGVGTRLLFGLEKRPVAPDPWKDLMKEFNIESYDDKIAWEALAKALAYDYHPDFKGKPRKGRPPSWRNADLAMLANEIDALKLHNDGWTDQRAIKRIIETFGNDLGHYSYGKNFGCLRRQLTRARKLGFGK